MITISETLVARHSPEEVFAFIADFGHIADWDPNITSSRRAPGALSVGDEANLRVKFGLRELPMTYTLLELEEGQRAVWRGENTTSISVDTIEVEPAEGGGAKVCWSATLEFKGALAITEPAITRAFEKLGRQTIEALSRTLAADTIGAPVVTAPEGIGATLWGALSKTFDATVAPSFGAPGYHARRRTWADPDIEVDLDGRHMVITGANSGLGKATADALLARGADVTMVCRSRERGERAREELRRKHLSASVALELADMGDMESVTQLATRLAGRPIHALVHNAGALLDSRQHTPQGHEVTFAVHVLGPHLLTRALREQLESSMDTRLVFVSSGGMYTQRLVVKALPDGLRTYDGPTVYAQAKRAQVYLAGLWAKELGDSGVAVSSMHPGWADTPGVVKSLPRFHKLTQGILRTPEQGADTIVWLAASPEGSMARGEFYLDREPREQHAPLARTKPREGDVEALWALCQTMSDPYLP